MRAASVAGNCSEAGSAAWPSIQRAYAVFALPRDISSAIAVSVGPKLAWLRKRTASRRETCPGAGATVTITDSHALPPGPSHCSVKLVVPVSAPVEREPLGGRSPLQPSSAVQPVAWVESQVSVAEPPSSTVNGLAASVITGNCGTATATVTVLDTEPPGPLQSST